MLLSLSTGLVLGLTAGITPGPLLAFIISQALNFGTKEGIKAAMAPLISDLPIIVIALFIVWRLSAFHWVPGILSFVGAAYIAYLAWGNLHLDPDRQPTGDDNAKSVRKGVLVNLLNPHAYFFWLTVGIPLLSKTWKASPFAAILWVAGFYVALVGSKLGLAVVVGRTRSFLKSRLYLWINRTLAMVLLLFAVLLVINGLKYTGVL